MGAELDFTARPTSFLTFTGMLSLGNWEYSGNPLGTVYDESQNVVGEATVILDGQKVDDAAQTTWRLGATIEPVENLFFDASWYHAADLYAQFDVLDLQDQDSDGLPDGTLTPFHVSSPASASLLEVASEI